MKNERVFLNFLFHFWNLHQILKSLRKNMMVIANEFPKLETVKNFDRPPCKKHRLGTRFDSQHLKLSQILAKSPSECFYQLFSSLSENLIWKMPPLVLGKISGLFLNALIADGKYPVGGLENLQLPMQMPLSQKPKSFSRFFFRFLEC